MLGYHEMRFGYISLCAARMGRQKAEAFAKYFLVAPAQAEAQTEASLQLFDQQHSNITETFLF